MLPRRLPRLWLCGWLLEVAVVCSAFAHVGKPTKHLGIGANLAIASMLWPQAGKHSRLCDETWVTPLSRTLTSGSAVELCTAINSLQKGEFIGFCTLLAGHVPGTGVPEMSVSPSMARVAHRTLGAQQGRAQGRQHHATSHT